jgi:YesN/AraC family two-component response regulator
VESRTGFGSTFTVWLRSGANHFTDDQLRDPSATRSGIGPLVEEELALLEVARDPGARDGGGEDAGPTDDDVPTVLIVDDNVEVAAFIRSHLEKRFRCIEARDGEAALALTRQRLPDVVVSDVMMPRMSGIELLKALRADPDIAYVPVLLLTAKAGQEHKLEGLEAGAAAYLTKPFDSAELEARIEGLIEQQRALRERMRREALLHTSPPEVSTPADRFLIKLRETIEANLADEDFDVRALARAMSESRSSLYRHIHDMTGETPSNVLKRLRLERAEGMLTARAGSIQEIAYAVGFKSVSHFSRSFREQYGVPPSRYPQKQ